MVRKIHNIGVLEATSSCNLKCPSCVAWTDKSNQFVSIETALKSIHLFDRFNIKQVQLYWRGDPCVHPKLYEIAEVMEKYITIVSTNGSTKFCQDEEYMGRLLRSINHYAVCLDGDRETLTKYRVGSNFDKVINNIKIASQFDCDKILSVLMFKHNEGKELFFLEIAEKYGFRLEFKKPNILGKRILTKEEQDEWLHYDNNRYIKGVHQSTDKCPDGNIIVGANGDIPLCGQFTENTKGLGTINDSFKKIKTNYQKVQEKMFNRQLSKCDDCLCLVKCVDS